MTPLFDVIEPARRFAPRRWPTRETELTTYWKDGSITKLNRFGETERRTTEPEAFDKHVGALLDALAGVVAPAPAAAPVLVIQDLDEDSEVSL